VDSLPTWPALTVSKFHPLISPIYLGSVDLTKSLPHQQAVADSIQPPDLLGRHGIHIKTEMIPTNVSFTMDASSVPSLRHCLGFVSLSARSTKRMIDGSVLTARK
jgi:hypothetical protein